MKEKMNYLFNFLKQKVNKDTFKKDSVQRAIKLTICGAFIFALILQLVSCLFGPIAASAYYNDYAQTAQVIVVDELPTIDIDDNAIYMISGSDDDNSIVGTWVLNENPSSVSTPVNYNITVVYKDISYNAFTLRGNWLMFQQSVETVGSTVSFFTNDEGSSSFEYMYVNQYLSGQTNLYAKNVLTNRIFYIAGGTDINNVNFITWLEANATKQGDSGSGSSVITYYVHYNDTWFDTDNISTAVTFLNYRINDPAIVNTLDVLLDGYTGSFDSLVDMLNSTNYQEYEDLIHYYRNEAYNNGASDSLVLNFFGNMLSGVVSAIDNIRIYEEVLDDNDTPSDPSDDTVFYISIWTILCSILLLMLIIALLKVWRGG